MPIETLTAVSNEFQKLIVFLAINGLVYLAVVLICRYYEDEEADEYE